MTPPMEVLGLYKIIPLKVLRRMGEVEFDMVPLPPEGVSGIDRVWHKGENVLSPDSVNSVERPWYMHPAQDDYLLMFNGTRYNELYRPGHNNNQSIIIESTTEYIKIDGVEVHRGSSAIVMWPRHVFHRIRSNGAISINLAVRHDGFDIDTEFNVYDVDLASGQHTLLRKGSENQPGQN